jgi:hypothetical protein
MKKYLLMIALMVVSNMLFAQGVRINLYGAYAFDDHFEAYGDSYNYYEGTIEGGFIWGAGIEYSLRDTYGIELLYQRQDTHAPTSWQTGQFVGIQNEELSLSNNFIMLGGNRRVIKSEGKIEGYAGLMAGMLIADVSNESNSRSESFTKFAWGLRLGVNIWASEKVGLKLQTQLLSAVQAAGGGAYFGTGGTGVGVSTYSTIYQFGLGGGLTFRVGKTGVE